MYMDSIIPTIIDRYESFTRVEQTIADYFISNKYIDDFSIKAMKERVYVSEASLSRFAKKLGFRGYREFIYEYEQMFHNPTETLHTASSVIKTYGDLLSRFDYLIDTNQMKRISRMISQYNHTFVIGIGSSGLAAEEMKRRFIRLGIVIDSCDQADIMKMQSIFQDEKSLVVGISLSGKNEEVLFSLRQASLRGAKTVFITGLKDEKDYINEWIVIPALENLDAGHIISPQFPILVYIDLLYNSFLEDNQQKLKLHEKTIEVIGRK